MAWLFSRCRGSRKSNHGLQYVFSFLFLFSICFCFVFFYWNSWFTFRILVSLIDCHLYMESYCLFCYIDYEKGRCCCCCCFFFFPPAIWFRNTIIYMGLNSNLTFLRWNLLFPFAVFQAFAAWLIVFFFFLFFKTTISEEGTEVVINAVCVW